MLRLFCANTFRRRRSVRFDQFYVSAVDFDETLFGHAPKFARHRAAVDADIVGEARLRKGQGKIRALVFGGQHGEIGGQLFARRPLRKDLQMFGKRLRLFAHQLYEIGNDGAVMGARFRAALYDMLVIDVQDVAVFVGGQKKSSRPPRRTRARPRTRRPFPSVRKWCARRSRPSSGG